MMLRLLELVSSLLWTGVVEVLEDCRVEDVTGLCEVERLIIEDESDRCTLECGDVPEY